MADSQPPPVQPKVPRPKYVHRPPAPRITEPVKIEDKESAPLWLKIILLPVAIVCFCTAAMSASILAPRLNIDATLPYIIGSGLSAAVILPAIIAGLLCSLVKTLNSERAFCFTLLGAWIFFTFVSFSNLISASAPKRNPVFLPAKPPPGWNKTPPDSSK